MAVYQAVKQAVSGEKGGKTNEQKALETLVDNKVGEVLFPNIYNKIQANKATASVPDFVGTTALEALGIIPDNDPTHYIKSKYKLDYGNGKSYMLYENKNTGLYAYYDPDQKSYVNLNKNQAQMLKQKDGSIDVGAYQSHTGSSGFGHTSSGRKDSDGIIVDTTSFDTSKTGSSGSGSGGGGNTYINYNSPDYSNYWENLLAGIKELTDAQKKPKVWTAEELAKQFNVEDTYNMDYITRMYQDATNKYYTDAIAEQQKYNNDALTASANYATHLLDKYVQSYNNATPTAMGRGTLAANALLSMINATRTNEETGSQLNDIINDYKNKWNADLIQDQVEARKKYNATAEWLVNRGLNTNTAEVQDYIHNMDAYKEAYAGIRNAQSTEAASKATAYQYNTNAALAKNQLAAAQEADNTRKRIYQQYFGTENNAWQKAYNATNHDERTSQIQKSSAN